MENIRSFEEIAIKDTFDDLYATIEPLIDDKKYDEARNELKKELHLLAESLGGSTSEQLTMLKSRFNAFLPEKMRLLLDAKTPEETEEGEKKVLDANEPENEIIARMEKEGWRIVDIVTDAYTVSAEDTPEKEIRVIGQGKRKLIFERDKNNFHEDYNYE
jgi:hypothetical protein